MSAPVSVVLFGYGLGGRVFHAPLVRSTPGLDLRAVVTSDPGRQDQARQDIPGIEVITDPAQVWDRADEFDLAIVGGANITHVPVASSALSAGLHVVIDKPMAADAEQATELASLAESVGRQVHPFQNRRWDSDYLTLREVVASGRLGDVHRFESRIERMRTGPMQGWRALPSPDEMGGVLYDFGAHLVDQALELLGPVDMVQAFARSIHDPRLADDDMQITMRHTSGAISTVWGSQAAAFGTPRFTVFGTQGGLRIDASDSQETHLKERLIADAPDWGTEPPEAAGVLRVFGEQVVEERIPLARGAWPEAYAAIRDSVLGQAPPPVPVDDAIANLRVLDAARASLNKPVVLDPPAAHA